MTCVVQKGLWDKYKSVPTHQFLNNEVKQKFVPFSYDYLKIVCRSSVMKFLFCYLYIPPQLFFFFFFSEVKCPGLLSLLFCKYLKPALSLKGVITVSPHSFNPCPHAALSLVLAQVFVWPYGASNDGTDSIYYYCF